MLQCCHSNCLRHACFAKYVRSALFSRTIASESFPDDCYIPSAQPLCVAAHVSSLITCVESNLVRYRQAHMTSQTQHNFKSRDPNGWNGYCCYCNAPEFHIETASYFNELICAAAAKSTVGLLE